MTVGGGPAWGVEGGRGRGGGGRGAEGGRGGGAMAAAGSGTGGAPAGGWGDGVRAVELEARLCEAEVRVLEERKARQLLKLRLVSAEEDGAMARAEAGALDDALHAERAAREAAESAAARANAELGRLREEVGVFRTKANMHEADLASARRQADTLEQRWIASQSQAAAGVAAGPPPPVAIAQPLAETAGLRAELDQLRNELQSLRSVAERGAGGVRRGGALRQQLVPAGPAAREAPAPQPEKESSPVPYPALKRKPGRPKGSKNKPAKEQKGKQVIKSDAGGVQKTKAPPKRSAMVDIAVRYDPPADLEDEDLPGDESPPRSQPKRPRRDADHEASAGPLPEEPDRAPLADVNTIWDLSRHRSKEGKTKGKKLLQSNSAFFNKLPPSMLFGKGFQMPKMNKPGPQ